MAEKSIIINLCDRCDYNESGGTKRSLPAGWMKLTKDIDLCPACTTGFQNWLAMPKEVAAENLAAEQADTDPKNMLGMVLNVAAPGVDPNPTMVSAVKQYQQPQK